MTTTHNLIDEVNGLLKVLLPGGSRIKIGCDWRQHDGLAIYRRPRLDPQTLDITLSGTQWLISDKTCGSLPIELRSLRAARACADEFAGNVASRHVNPAVHDSVDRWARWWASNNADAEYVGWPVSGDNGGPATGGHKVMRADDEPVDGVAALAVTGGSVAEASNLAALSVVGVPAADVDQAVALIERVKATVDGVPTDLAKLAAVRRQLRDRQVVDAQADDLAAGE